MKKGLLITLIFATLYSCGNKQNAQQDEPQKVPTMTMSEQNVELQSTYPVTIKGQEDIEIRPRIDGFIDAIYVDEGSPVKKGQVLFKINSPQAEQALASAKAAVASAQASANTAKLNVDRMRPLADKDIISPVQLQSYENAYQSALSGLAQAQASLTQAQATESWTNVTSPINGVVGTIPMRQGSLVNSSNSLTTIASTTNMFAYFSLNEKDLLKFLEDMPGKTQADKIKQMPDITLILADGTQYPEKGRIETISGLVDISTGAATLRAKFPNPTGLLRSGTSGKVFIPRTMNNVFLIPQKATFSQQDKVMIFKVQGDSIVQKVITVTTTPDGQSYAVLSGLESGDIIVSDGVATLKNGKKVKID